MVQDERDSARYGGSNVDDVNTFYDFHEYMDELCKMQEWSTAIDNGAARDQYWTDLMEYMGGVERAEAFEYHVSNGEYKVAYALAGHTEITVNQRMDAYHERVENQLESDSINKTDLDRIVVDDVRNRKAKWAAEEPTTRTERKMFNDIEEDNRRFRELARRQELAQEFAEIEDRYTQLARKKS